MEIELKSCPFCGGEVAIAFHGTKERGYWWSITRGVNKGTRCRCRVFMESEKFSDRNEKRKNEELLSLAKRWNRRVD